MRSDSMETTERDLIINVKRIYEPASKKDGFRILVDRLWPRGLKKSQAGVDLWLREIAPCAELRKWFNHDPERWPEFVADYNFQLNKNRQIAGQLIALIKQHKKVSLLYAAQDEQFNNAIALKGFLDKFMKADHQ
ncbi:DUF488 family protein [Dyadobacter sp. CY107]|uniref:DUF488 domain-containing protein n=1 Tax=Dyadobacter fanqingshengii TaxID=2906443 RepID=UPI001F461D76|nr:DUF488 family protein [Dyadobacter fanqingshengii]MCF2502155.1 DUF488 family protein [Dyadobacter fanqingshengii]